MNQMQSFYILFYSSRKDKYKVAQLCNFISCFYKLLTIDCLFILIFIIHIHSHIRKLSHSLIIPFLNSLLSAPSFPVYALSTKRQIAPSYFFAKPEF